MRRFPAVLLVAVTSTTLIAPGEASAQGREVSLTAPPENARDQPVILGLPWNENRVNARSYRWTRRVTPDKALSVRIYNFNFIRFTPVVGSTAQEIPQYNMLTSLWSQALSVSLPAVNLAAPMAAAPAGPPPVANEFLVAFAQWRASITAARDTLKIALDSVPSRVALDSTAVARIAVLRQNLERNVARMDSARKATEAEIVNTLSSNEEAYYAQSIYDTESRIHREISDQIGVYTRQAALTEGGQTYTIDRRDAGTIVTTTITVRANTDRPEDTKAAAAEVPTVISHVVDSRLPVQFHTGPAYTNINAVSFEKVRAADGTDVFRLIDEPDASADLVAYLSYELASVADQARGIYLTLGTGLRRPGEQLFVGATARLHERLFLTGGGMSRQLREGTQAIGDDLFTSLRGVTKWGWFAGISTTPF